MVLNFFLQLIQLWHGLVRFLSQGMCTAWQRKIPCHPLAKDQLLIPRSQRICQALFGLFAFLVGLNISGTLQLQLTMLKRLGVLVAHHVFQ